MPGNNNNGNNNRGKGIKNTCCPKLNNNNNNGRPPVETNVKKPGNTQTENQSKSSLGTTQNGYYSQSSMPGVPNRDYPPVLGVSGTTSSYTPAPQIVGTSAPAPQIVGTSASAPQFVGTSASNNGLPSYNNAIAKSKIKSNNNTSVLAMNNKRNYNNNGNNKKLGLKDRAKEAVNRARKSLLGETGKQILVLLSVASITFLLMYFVRKWLLDSRNNTKYFPYLIEGSKSGKSSLVISTNPNEESSVPLYRSDNQDGAEFTYSFWMVVDSMEYNYGKWKHVFHRGNKTSFPNRSPGVWIHPETNTLRVYMNTYEDPLNYVDIENIPIKKWFHVAVVLNHKYLDIYFNGKLRHRKELKSAPRQNFGPFWAGLFGGFEGYLSKVKYFNKALEYDEIEKIVKAGPSKDACGDTGDYPPYLDDSWWFDMKV